MRFLMRFPRNNVNIGKIAKELGYGAWYGGRHLNLHLKTLGVIAPDPVYRWVLTPAYKDSGFMFHIKHEPNDWCKYQYQCKWTPKGREFIHQCYIDGDIPKGKQPSCYDDDYHAYNDNDYDDYDYDTWQAREEELELLERRRQTVQKNPLAYN